MSPQDRTFLMTAIMGDIAQITLGQRAEKGGPAINSFGVMLVQERYHARDQANQLAKAEGVTPPDQTSQKSSRDRSRLEKLSGPQFNYAFIKYIITADRSAIKAYRREAQGRGPVAELARATLPSLQEQLRALRYPLISHAK
jgi:putative membrane protein